MVGYSAANTRQLTAVRGAIEDTVDSGRQNTAASAETKAGKDEEKKTAETELTPEERRRISELQRQDAAVRAHEQAHIAVGRDLITSGPRYEYTYGPDGKQYAVSGEVGIDTSPEREPQANIDKGQHIQATALAPVDPSPQDYQVASTGKQLEQQGYRDLRDAQRSEAAERAEQLAEQRQAEPLDKRLQAYISPLGQAPQVDAYA